MKLDEAISLAHVAVTQSDPLTEERKEASRWLRALLAALSSTDGAAIRHAVVSHRVSVLRRAQEGIEQAIQHVDAAPRECRDKAKAHRLHQEWQALEAQIDALRAEAVR